MKKHSPNKQDNESCNIRYAYWLGCPAAWVLLTASAAYRWAHSDG